MLVVNRHRRPPLRHPPLDRRHGAIEEGIDRDRDDGRRHEGIAEVIGDQAELRAEGRDDERELANLRERDGDAQADADGIAPHRHEHERDERLADEHDGER